MTDPTDEPSGSKPPPVRRHLIVLGICVIGVIIGVTLVLTGRNDPTDAPTTTAAVNRGPLLADLGAVKNMDAAKALIATLDPATLRPTGDTTTTLAASSTADAPTTSVAGVDLTESGVQRCQQAIAQQNTDRSLGDRLAASRLMVGRKPTFVVSYTVPAAASLPAGTRVLVTDARTCRVLGAVQQ